MPGMYQALGEAWDRMRSSTFVGESAACGRALQTGYGGRMRPTQTCS